jgi:hypothetical protein
MLLALPSRLIPFPANFWIGDYSTGSPPFDSKNTISYKRLRSFGCTPAVFIGEAGDEKANQ